MLHSTPIADSIDLQLLFFSAVLICLYHRLLNFRASNWFMQSVLIPQGCVSWGSGNYIYIYIYNFFFNHCYKEVRGGKLYIYIFIYFIYLFLFIFLFIFIFFQVSLVRRILPVTLIQTWLSASECTHTRYRVKTVCSMFTFIIRRDSEGSDVGRFSLANTILKIH